MPHQSITPAGESAVTRMRDRSNPDPEFMLDMARSVLTAVSGHGRVALTNLLQAVVDGDELEADANAKELYRLCGVAGDAVRASQLRVVDDPEVATEPILRAAPEMTVVPGDGACWHVLADGEPITGSLGHCFSDREIADEMAAYYARTCAA